MEKLKAFCRTYGLGIIAGLHLIGLLSIIFWQIRFAAFTPVNLLVTAAIIGLAHKGKRLNFWLFFIITYLLGYGVELLGTKTGFPFGYYSYGENLEPLIFDVPWIIGVNWFLLAMASGFLTQKIIKHQWLRIPSAALLMVFADMFIEQVAPVMDYWSWKDDIVPWVNYLGWLAVSIVVQALWTYYLRNAENRLAAGYFYIVLAFFIILNLAL